MKKLKPYGYVMKFESGIEVFNTEEYELTSDKRISSIPLYTHPVKEQLTDEEILSCWHEYGQILTIQQIRIHFANAILRKASEK